MAKGDWPAACAFEGKAGIAVDMEMSTKRPKNKKANAKCRMKNAKCKSGFNEVHRYPMTAAAQVGIVESKGSCPNMFLALSLVIRRWSIVGARRRFDGFMAVRFRISRKREIRRQKGR
jgi:hypothetical protein